MAYPIYSPPSYALGLGAVDMPSDKAKAEAALKAMQRSLKGWLKSRAKVDAIAAGKITPAALFRRPGARPLPASAVAATLRQDRLQVEQDLADQLYALLKETGCHGVVYPDVKSEPNAAVRVAEIALAGKCPSDADRAPAGQEGLGIIWFVLLIPIAGVVIVLSQIVKSKADVAKHQADMQCIQSGHCTDTGFWLKVASVSVLAWLAWDKFGVRERVVKWRSK
jgi:hypothetical protein